MQNFIPSSILGFPRIGANREVKKAIEAYWAGKISESDLLALAKQIRLTHWTAQSERGVDVLPVGDFSLYDHILDMSTTFGVIPKRYQNLDLNDVELYFAMGRGLQRSSENGTRAAVDVPACEMKKFFDSNYHYIVPELGPSTEFTLNASSLIEQFEEVKAAGFSSRVVVFGPISYLMLSKPERDVDPNFNPLSLLDKLVSAYQSLFQKLADVGAEWIQVDEPYLVTDSARGLSSEYQRAFTALSAVGPNILLATYYGSIDATALSFVNQLPIQGLHIDLERGLGQLEDVLTAVKNKEIILSLGLVDGRNIWKADLAKAIKTAQHVVSVIGNNRVIINTTSSLLHTPHTLAAETKLDAQVKDWFSFALEKCAEVSIIAKALSNPDSVALSLEKNITSIESRRKYCSTGNVDVRKRVDSVTSDMYVRKSSFEVRQTLQREKLKLLPFPTTTIGSFPQTKEIRIARKKYTSGEITEEQYDEFLKDEIRRAVEFQERVGFDMFVHGEPERNDMVQYFGEQLEGFVFTTSGWVQSFGTRYVRPPIIVGDVSRPSPMTVKWSKYAQSITKAPMKGMLTGPVTILNWSFPREDVSKEVSSRQLALALRDEVLDLERAGIAAIQVDEPAIREGLPLKKSEWATYLTWAVASFRLATAGVQDTTQIHSHFCYSDFNDMMDSIQKLDADVITIENSKSDAKLLKVFDQVKYANEIGPGLFDIHSPRVPSVEEMYDRLVAISHHLPKENLWVNPDCGLKTRGWKECEEQCSNLVEVARRARKYL
ncbi:methionine-synthesizing 5- methyltetrahydropteroyltriglutamate--homocysteine methyltransferase [Nowakowskiella sp. JEL0407]|nr:methionine-synthesizing 5- methyltetrahydropteroyltriglutamate--homocysteine methyltransferase [Nowakowskiella sp. JEL0407]